MQARQGSHRAREPGEGAGPLPARGRVATDPTAGPAGPGLRGSAGPAGRSGPRRAQPARGRRVPPRPRRRSRPPYYE
eukprot:15358055-Heterocapsa_arctica.AAC.1